MVSIWNSLGIGILFGIIIVIFFLLKDSKNPPKNSSLTLTFGCMSETEFLSIPAGMFCLFTALEDKLSITMPTKPQTPTYYIDYDKLLKFNFTKKFSVDNKTYRQFKAKDIPDRVILEYVDDTNSIRQFEFLLTAGNKLVNRAGFWINNIFDYVNARMQH